MEAEARPHWGGHTITTGGRLGRDISNTVDRQPGQPMADGRRRPPRGPCRRDPRHSGSTPTP
eukprot:4667967-Pyramimonas_sp.AAC.1